MFLFVFDILAVETKLSVERTDVGSCEWRFHWLSRFTAIRHSGTTWHGSSPFLLVWQHAWTLRRQCFLVPLFVSVSMPIVCHLTVACPVPYSMVSFQDLCWQTMQQLIQMNEVRIPIFSSLTGIVNKFLIVFTFWIRQWLQLSPFVFSVHQLFSLAFEAEVKVNWLFLYRWFS